MTIPSHHIRATYIEPSYYHSIVNRLITIPSSNDMSITVVVTRVRVDMTWPVQRCASESSGCQGFPWCCSAWLFGPLRLSVICPGYWSSFPSSVTYSVERLVLHGAKCHFPWQFTTPMCPSSTSLQCYLYSASWKPFVQGWCSTIAASSIEWVVSTSHTPSSGSRKDSYHKHRHQVSRLW